MTPETVNEASYLITAAYSLILFIGGLGAGSIVFDLYYLLKSKGE